MTTADLILRCYGYEQKDGSWCAVCIDLNLDAEGQSVEDAKRSLLSAIFGYMETVAEVATGAPFAHLIRRPVSLKDRLAYHAIRFGCWFRRRVAFEAAIPIRPVVRREV